jgi:hypothetical protein
MRTLNCLSLTTRLLTALFLCSCAPTLRAQSISLGEALDTNLVWTTGGDALWFGQTTNSYDGVSAAGCILSGAGRESWLETTVVGPATLSFWSAETDWTVFPQSVTAGLTFVINPVTGMPGPVSPRLSVRTVFDGEILGESDGGRLSS